LLLAFYCSPFIAPPGLTNPGVLTGKERWICQSTASKAEKSGGFVNPPPAKLKRAVDLSIHRQQS
jgi:hypothetical protein